MDRSGAYGPALLAGAVAAAIMVGSPALLGTGGVWAAPGADLAQNLTGHLAVQIGPWRWPPLLAPALAWPHGLSVAMTDSNPAMTLVAMAAHAVAGGPPLNLLGLWFGLCWLLQPVGGVYAVRGLWALLAGGACPRALSLAGAAMAMLTPAWVMRFGHVNLFGHALLLLALGMAARMLAGPERAPGWSDASGWGRAGLLLGLAILVHPYLFVFAGLTLAAPALRQMVAGKRKAGLRGLALAAARPIGAALAPVALLALLSGTTGGADRGFGVYSMNLLSPVWPQRSGLFGPDLPVLDATGGQAEGFNYLGAGGLLLIALDLLLRRRVPMPRGLWPAWLVLAALTFLAVTPRAYAGRFLLLPAPLWPWDQIFGVVRASGRAFWPVGYALVLGGAVQVARALPRPAAAGLLGLAVLLQAADLAPMLGSARRWFAQGQPGQVALPLLPPGLRLLRTAPVCLGQSPLADLPDRLRLAAVQAGAAVADMRASRLPPWFNCESALSDALETRLAPGEVRALIGPPPGLMLEALGPGAECRVQGAVVLCAAGLLRAGLPGAGEPVAPGPPLPRPAGVLGEAALGAILATGWATAPDRGLWSEGPRASLLFATAAPGRLTLRLAGIAARPRGERPVVLRVTGAPPRPLDLPDQAETTLSLPVPAGPVQVAIDIHRPVDPARRGLSAPVRRAGVKLLGATLE